MAYLKHVELFSITFKKKSKVVFRNVLFPRLIETFNLSQSGRWLVLEIPLHSPSPTVPPALLSFLPHHTISKNLKN